MNSNLEKEIKSYSEFSKQSEQTTSKIYLFFKSYAEEGVKGIDKYKKILEEFFSELRREPSSTTNNVGFLGLYNDFHRYLESLKNIYLSIEKNIVEKLAYMVKKYNVIGI